MIEVSTLNFLNSLSANNSREWFNDNRKDYETAKENFIEFCDELLTNLKTIEPKFYNTQIKDCIFRINRDIRFSKDKSPYKNHFSAGFGEGGRNSGKIDYYFQLETTSAFLGGGMWQPSAENLKKFRQEIDYSPEKLLDIIENKEFKKCFPIIHGQKLKSKPKGYDQDHENIELLKYKELFFLSKYEQNSILDLKYSKLIFEHCKTLQPYIHYLNNLMVKPS